MTDAARPTEPIASIEHYRDLLERLNRDWRIEGYVAADGSLARRALYQVRRVLARLLGPQETFNSELVQLVNTLAPILSSLEQVERYREALAARERRMEAAFDQLRAEQQELRTVVAVLRQSNHDLTGKCREQPGRSAPRRAAAASTAPTGADVVRSAQRTSTSASRISSEAPPRRSRARLAGYVEIFAGASDVLDIGCGRGEFLALLKARGVRGARHRRQRLDGRGVRAEGPGGVEGRRARVPAGAAARVAGRPARRAGRRASRPVVPDQPARRGVRRVAARRADRARDHQSGLLVRVLRELRPRHHARAAAAPRHAEVPAAGERLLAASRSAIRRRTRSTTSCSGWRRRRSATPARRSTPTSTS